MSTSISPSSDHNPFPGDLAKRDRSAIDPQGRRDRTLKRWVTVVASLIMVAVLFLLIRLQGHVRGVEFAPTHFQQREFSFFEIPLIHVQITPIRRSATTRAHREIRCRIASNNNNMYPGFVKPDPVAAAGDSQFFAAGVWIGRARAANMS